MINKDHPRARQAVDSPRESARTRSTQPAPPVDTAIVERLSPHFLTLVDVADAAYDPYNTGAFRVLAQRAPRRSLDDMRKLDEEIRRSRKPWE